MRQQGRPRGSEECRAKPPETIFYDGHCGLCHGVVRFVLARDTTGEKFRFAPLQGDSFARAAGGITDGDRPDSVYLRTRDGTLLVKSNAVLYVLRRLGGGWRVAGIVFSLLPRAVRDAGYDLVARLRRRLFGTPDTLCPLVPDALRDRFDP